MNIKINGSETQALSAYSCGPGEAIHTYDVRGGYVYEIAGKWTLCLRNEAPRKVTVERQ